MVVDLVFLGVGLALLVIAADHFVLGASRVAKHFKVSPVAVGVVVMGFGTSLPELLVSALAAGQGDRDLGVGNIVGSNVANLSLVLGTAALVTTMTVSRGIIRREAALSVLATVIFALVVIDDNVARWEGLGLLVLLGVALFVIIKGGGLEEDDEHEAISLGREVPRVILGLIGTVSGAQLLIEGAVGVAERWGVTGGFVGFSLVALGTSLPELVTTVACARRGETELIAGNLLGSNIFNSLAVGAAIGIVGPGSVGDDTLITAGIGLMVLIAVVAFGLAAFSNPLSSRDGSVLLALYVAAMIILGVGATDEEIEEDAPTQIDQIGAPAPAGSEQPFP